MKYDPELAAMLAQPWSNNACRGYVIYAMENCGFSPSDIRRVVAELYEVFDIRGLEEAQQHFENSPYFGTTCPKADKTKCARVPQGHASARCFVAFYILLYFMFNAELILL